MASVSSCVFALQIMFLLFIAVAASAAPRGFTVDLIHRDSPKSPFYEPMRSRLLSAYVPLGSAFSDTINGFGVYMMKIQIGTPPVEIVGVLDTGSDLIWTQCSPCINCFKQDAPIFNPISSSTYRDVTCASSQCQSVYKVHCDNKDDGCPYSAFYGTGFSIGTIGVDTVTLHTTSNEPLVMSGSVLGCGHNNTGFSSQTSGIIGLGWGPSSLISQMGDSAQGLFSYCFGSKTSKINFGANAIVSGDGTVSTTIFRKSTRPTNYFLNLESVSVNEVLVETSGTSMQSVDGNIFIDSGSTLTVLPADYYLRVKAAVESAVKAEIVDHPDMTCYRSSNLEEFPVITMHFTGADLVLGKSNTFINIAPDVICFAIITRNGVPSIFGNLAQSNFLIGYDIFSETISFKPTDCSALWS